jgi:NAD(P)-dependent dehydrogenase (short-subunit alcohol dehydrogenase family)
LRSLHSLLVASVKKAAEAIRKESPEGIHVMCLNAGIQAYEDKATIDGFDVQVQTNHLSHFLLTSLLWDLVLKAAETSGEARVVTHTDQARKNPKKNFAPSYWVKKGGGRGGGGGRWVRDQQSKLANLLFAYELGEVAKKAGSKVKVCGVVAYLEKGGVGEGRTDYPYTRATGTWEPCLTLPPVVFCLAR